MKVFYSLEEASAGLSSGVISSASGIARPASVLTWGNFDGVHLGHQSLLRALVAKAKNLGLPSVVMTFTPRPAVFFNAGYAPKAIADLDDKLALLEKCGVDYTLVLPFTSEIASLAPVEFLEKLALYGLGAKALVLGYDVAFGRGREGNFDFLNERRHKYGFELDQVPPYYLGERAVSSTWIREELAQGSLDSLPALLGRQHSVHGTVQPGYQRGRSVLGFATANLDPGPLLLPPNGVYACLARCDGAYYAAATNLGFNPSFGGDKISLEAHILDFSGEIYGKDLRLYFIERLRGEKTFSSPDELGLQITKDVQRTRDVIGEVLSTPDFSARYPL
ncbi:bifunctional riboflavin kinase/FAD synthetase [Desulfovibrio sp. OttesenSCG-928-C06]|nr:bifunctional riboflavin kinase/FAD synthetase [Desulfovibrio sp. OttesenSCG-928-C06]